MSTKRVTDLEQRRDALNVRIDLEKRKDAHRNRKKRAHELIELGGLVKKAGLDTWPRARLLGAMMAAAKTTDPAKLQLWEQKGHAELNGVKEKVVAIAAFDGPIDDSKSTTLKSLGFKFNPLRMEWEGRIPATEAAEAVQKLGGRFNRLR